MDREGAFCCLVTIKRIASGKLFLRDFMTHRFSRNCVLAVCLSVTILPAAVWGQQSRYPQPGFISPSGNILCYPRSWQQDAGAEGVTCLIFETKWQAPRAVPGCDVDETNMFSIGLSGPARGELTCHGDIFWPYTQRVLEYGHQAEIEGVTCRSESSGMRCENQEGYYFLLSRQGYETGK